MIGVSGIGASSLRAAVLTRDASTIVSITRQGISRMNEEEAQRDLEVCGSMCGSRNQRFLQTRAPNPLPSHTLAFRIYLEQRIDTTNAHHFWWAFE
jgi:hypothetical protein